MEVFKLSYLVQNMIVISAHVQSSLSQSESDFEHVSIIFIFDFMTNLTDEELENEYKELKPLMFPGILDKLSQIDEKCDQISREILISNRKSLYNLYALSICEHTKQAFKFDNLICSGSVPPNDALRIFEPLEVQSITMLLKVLLSDPPKFVNGILSCIKKSEFITIAYLTVPAVYSFFSSKETAGFAFSFYVELARKAPFDIFSLFVSQYFNSSTCNVFITLLFKKMFWT